MLISGVIDPHKDTRHNLSNSNSHAKSGFFNQEQQVGDTLPDEINPTIPLKIKTDILQSRGDNSRNNTKMEHLAEEIKMINHNLA